MPPGAEGQPAAAAGGQANVDVESVAQLLAEVARVAQGTQEGAVSEIEEALENKSPKVQDWLAV